MSDVKLDTDGDVLIENGDLVLVDGLAAIGQHVAMRLRSYKGEWFLDQNAGVPYFQEILEKGTPEARIRSILQRIILDTEGITSVDSMDLDYDAAARTLVVDFQATTVSGETLASVEEITV